MGLHQMWLVAECDDVTKPLHTGWLAFRGPDADKIRRRRKLGIGFKHRKVKVSDSLFRKVKDARYKFTPTDSSYALVMHDGDIADRASPKDFDKWDGMVKRFVKSWTPLEHHEVEGLLRKHGFLRIEVKPHDDFPWRHDPAAFVRWVTDFEIAGRPNIARLSLKWLKFVKLVPDGDCMCAAKGCDELAAYEYQGDNPHMSPVVCLYHYSIKIDTVDFKPSEWEELGWWDEVRGRAV